VAKEKKLSDEEKIEQFIKKGAKKLEELECNNKKGVKKHVGSGGSCIWFLGFVGSAVYYIQQASSFGSIVVGLLKALFWPAFLAYNLLKFLQM
jgi:hypothetical protein